MNAAVPATCSQVLCAAAPAVALTPSKTVTSLPVRRIVRKAHATTIARTIRVAELERRVLEGIERRLLAPEIIAEFLKEYHSEQRRLRKEASRQRREADKRVCDLDRHISNIIDSIAEGVATSGMKTKLIELEGEKEALLAKMAAFSQADNVVEFHPATIEAYRKKIAELQAALASDEPGRREAMEIVRSLVNGIQIVPLVGRGQVELRVCGALAELLNLPSRQSGEPPNAATVVAEVRYMALPTKDHAVFCYWRCAA